MSIITEIKSVEDFDLGKPSDWYKYEGFIIKTESDLSYVLIDNCGQCCESWGYFEDNDEDLSYYVGAELLSMEVIDEDLINHKMIKAYSKDGHIDVYDGGAVFVNVNTSKGSFQLSVYNSHNGYYGHTVLAGFKQTDVNNPQHIFYGVA